MATGEEDILADSLASCLHSFYTGLRGPQGRTSYYKLLVKYYNLKCVPMLAHVSKLAQDQEYVICDLSRSGYGV